jgi:hypothetical protein
MPERANPSALALSDLFFALAATAAETESK